MSDKLFDKLYSGFWFLIGLCATAFCLNNILTDGANFWKCLIFILNLVVLIAKGVRMEMNLFYKEQKENNLD